MLSNPNQEKILVVESSLEDRDLIARQALKPLGYKVKTAELASTGIQLALMYNPDLIISNLHLPDLSGKDLLVALQSQSIDTPVVLIANQGQENEVIQAFRLGATDYLSKPLREAEIVATVERALQNVRARKEREALADQLQTANTELERRVRNQTTLISLGKAVTSATRQQELFEIIVDGAIRITDAQRGYLLIRSNKNDFHLSAFANLPKSLTSYLNRPMDDGITSLVVLSGKSLAMHGEPLKRFNISQLGKAVLVVPVKAKKETIGLLVSIRQDDIAFQKSDQDMLEAVADYAAISMVNARLFKALEERALSLQEALNNTKNTSGVKQT